MPACMTDLHDAWLFNSGPLMRSPLGVACLKVNGWHGGRRAGRALGFELGQVVLLCAEVPHEHLPQLVLPRAGCGHPHMADHTIDEL